MHARNGRASLVLSLAVLSLAVGCASATEAPALPLPPVSPRASSSFSAEFVPAGTERYSPTDTKDVVRFKNLLHWPGKPDLARGDAQPTRPYVRVGELRFGEGWYHSSNIQELVDTHVPRVGGDAVLVYHAYQRSVAQVQGEGGSPEDVYFQSIVLEVIRYTDG
jgi:hypothetical protein